MCKNAIIERYTSARQGMSHSAQIRGTGKNCRNWRKPGKNREKLEKTLP